MPNTPKKATATTPTQPKSPAKRKQPLTGPQEKSARTTRSQSVEQHEMISGQPESPRKEKKGSAAKITHLLPKVSGELSPQRLG